MDSIDIEQFVLPYLWYLVLGVICIASFLFGYRKAAAVWGLLFVLLLALPTLRSLGATLRNMF